MYSIDLTKITLDEFQEILTSIDLLPSRRVLLENLPKVIAALQENGISQLESLRKWLANKQKYSQLAASLAVSAEYLTILNREVNSYLSKPIPLAALGILTESELTTLGIKTTRELYEQATTPALRQQLATRCSIPPEKILHALQLSDLLRINGVGPAYAALLWQIGVQSAAGYLHLPSAEILARCQQAGAKLGLKDVEYCKRFCRKLDSDIEW